MHRTIGKLCLLLVLGSLLGIPALAEDAETQGAGGPDMEAMMAAMEAAMKPGEHHEFLARMAGEWTFTNTMWMDPSQPPVTSDGTSTKTMILGGRYLEDETHGEAMGKPFDGYGVTGYDNTGGEFVGTWIDSMTTSIAVAKGERDGDTLTMHGEYVDPMSKQTMKVRAVTRVVNKNYHVFEYFMTMPGAPEFKSMVIEYRRKGAM